MAQWGSLSPIFITQSPSRPSSRSAPSPPLSFTNSDFWPTDSPYASNDDHLPFDYIDLTAEPPSPSPPFAAPMAHRQTSPAVQELLPTSDEPHTAKRRRLNNGGPESVILPDDSPKQKIEEVDLRGVDDDRDLSKLLEQQRADTIKAQQEQSNKPVRLSTLQCVVCMENMTNITATHCGKLISNSLNPSPTTSYHTILTTATTRPSFLSHLSHGSSDCRRKSRL